MWRQNCVIVETMKTVAVIEKRKKEQEDGKQYGEGMHKQNKMPGVKLYG